MGPPGAFRGSAACRQPGLGPAASRAVRRSWCRFTPRSVWPFAMAAPRCRVRQHATRETEFLKKKETNGSGFLLRGDNRKERKTGGRFSP